MRVNELNPFIRFAENISFKSRKAQVNVFDCRIFSIVSGELEIWIDQNSYLLKAGDLFYCSAGSCYQVCAAENCSIDVLNFDMTQSYSDIKKNIPPHKIRGGKKLYKNEIFIDDCDELNGYIYIENGYELQLKIKKIIKVYAQQQPFFAEKCSSVLKETLIDMYLSRYSLKTPALKTLESVTNFISLNINKKITNGELAGIAGYHPYHLNRIFLKYTGTTVHQYIMAERISAAKNLLSSTDMTMLEIAENTGFNSSTHFCGCFKEAVGCSPSQYRKEKRPIII